MTTDSCVVLGLTALGNLHFPPVAAPKADVLDEHQGLDLANLGDGSVVLLKLRVFSRCALASMLRYNTHSLRDSDAC
jgi:hypothetical protein